MTRPQRLQRVRDAKNMLCERLLEEFSTGTGPAVAGVIHKLVDELLTAAQRQDAGAIAAMQKRMYQR